jgi:hypothetical protein
MDAFLEDLFWFIFPTFLGLKRDDSVAFLLTQKSHNIGTARYINAVTFFGRSFQTAARLRITLQEI